MFLTPLALKLSEFFELKLELSVGFFYQKDKNGVNLTGLVLVNLELFEKCDE
jgi:hypothetical protein